MQQEPFRQLREHHPERLKKLSVIPGDVTIEGLDLSPSNRDCLIQQVSVVFHGAANVKFDVPLKDAITMNTKGTANVLALAKQVFRFYSNLYLYFI